MLRGGLRPPHVVDEEVYLANVLDLEARVLVGSMTDSCRVRKGGERGVWVVPRLVGSKRGQQSKRPLVKNETKARVNAARLEYTHETKLGRTHATSVRAAVKSARS